MAKVTKMWIGGPDGTATMIDMDNYRAPFPHCDQHVLHAPGECEYCDHYPDHQKVRVEAKINFTGHHDADKAPCPAEERRELNKINRWHGNVPYTYQMSSKK